MTTTNRAFIKAYRQDAAESAPATPSIAGTARPAAVAASAAVESTNDAAGDRSALYGPQPTSIPANTSRRHESHATTAKQPLSSFIARRPLSAPEDGPNETEFLRPGTTIASFHWPPVCRTLAQQCGGQLEVVADRLVAEAEADRSLIGVMGLQAGQGATTTSLCLAARLAGRGRRVILVDGNFQNPCLAGWLEATPNTGWQDVLKHGGSLSDAVVRAQANRFDLLALEVNDRKPASGERLAGGLQAVVTAGVLRHAYDHVLIDAGAVLDESSQPIVLALVRNMGIDAVLAVTGPEPAAAGDLATIATHLGRSGCELLGTIENRAAKSPAS